MQDLDKQIYSLQQSTRTAWKAFIPLHNLLRQKSRAYYKWHVSPYAKVVHASVLVFYLVGVTLGVLTFNTQKASAAAITWDGGGSTNNWSEAANWSGDVVPGSGDTLTFNSTSTKDATVDASFTGTITNINIASGYTGTITLARSLTTSTTFTQAAGTFTAANQNLTIGTTFTLSAGVFTASSAITDIGGAITISGSPTFNHNSGTVNISGSSSVTLSCNSVAFNLVTFNMTGTKTVSSNCSLPLGADPTLLGSGQVALGGTVSGSGTLTKTSGTFRFNSGAVLSGFSGLNTGTTIVSGGTIDLTNYTSVTFASLAVSSGTLTAPAGPMTVSGAFTISSTGAFVANTTSVITLLGSIDCGPGTSTMTMPTGSRFTLSNSVTLAINASCDATRPIVIGDNATMAGSNVTNNGVISGTGTFTKTSGTLTMASGSGLSGFSGVALAGFTVSGATVDLSSYSTVDFNNTLTLSSGSLKLPAGTTTAAGALTFSGGTFDANGGTMIFDGGAATLSCNNVTFHLVSFVETTGTKTVSSNCSLPLGTNPSLPTSMVLNGTLSGTGTITFTANTLAMGAGSSLSGFTSGIFNSLNVNGATADFSSYSVFDINSALSMGSGSLKVPSGTTTVAGALTFTGGSFDANGGTLSIDGNSSATLACNSATFNRVTFDHTAGSKTVGSNCNIPLGNNPTMTGAVIVSAGTLTGTGTLTSTLGFALSGGSTPLSGFTGLVVGGTTTLSGATVDLGTYTTVDLNGSLVLSAGSLKAPSGNMTIANSITFSGSGTFDANGGTITLDTSSTSTATYTCNNLSFNRIVIAHDGPTKTVSTGCNFPLGNNPSIAGAVFINGGTLSGSGTLSTNSSLTLTGGTTPFSGFSGLAVVGTVTVSGATVDLSNYSLVDIDGNLALTSGTFTAPSGAMTVGRSILFSDTGTFNANGGTLILDGSAISATQQCNNATFNRVVFAHTGIVKTVASDCIFPLGADPTSTGDIILDGTLSGSGSATFAGLTINSATASVSGFSSLVTSALTTNVSFNASSFSSIDTGNLTIAAGTFTAPSVLQVSGDFAATGTFSHNSGTVTFDGGSQSIAGENTFHNLTKTTSSEATLTFPASTTQTIAGALTLSGSAGKLLSLRSATDGTTWSINPQGSRSLSYLDVKDSNNVNATTLDTTNSVNSGNNTNWNFIVAPTETADPETPTVTTPVNALTKIGSTTLSKHPTRFTYASRTLTPSFSGTGKPNTKVTIVANNTQICATEIKTDGTWTCRSTALEPDSYTVTIRFTADDGSITELPAFTLITVLVTSDDSSSDQATVTSSEDATATSSSSNSSSPSSARYETNIRKLANGQLVISELRAIIKYKNNKPLANTKITLHSTPQTVTTNSQGIAIFKDVTLGEHELVYTTSRNTTIRVPLVVKALAAATARAESGEVVTIELSPVEIQLPNNGADTFRLLWPFLAVIGVLLGGYVYLYVRHQQRVQKSYAK